MVYGELFIGGDGEEGVAIPSGVSGCGTGGAVVG